MSWADIVRTVTPEKAEVDPSALDPDKKSLARSTKRWALRRGMTWPPEAGQEVLPTLKTMERKAQHEQEYLDACNGGPITRGARQWARENDLPWPPPGTSPKERCYLLKSEGKSWEEIQAEVGYKHMHHAIEAARRWAVANDLPWPLPGMRDHTGSHDRQASAYEMLMAGSSIEEVRDENGYKSVSGTEKGIMSHVKRNGLPVPERFASRTKRPHKIDTSRDAQVVTLRDQGWTWKRIRDHLDYRSLSGPQKAYRRFKETQP